jgi:hypothetical protein
MWGSEVRRTSRLVGSPQSSLSEEALPESIRVSWGFLTSSSVECRSSARILWILTESWLSSPSGVSGFWVVGIPVTLPRSGWFANDTRSFICFSYVICAFTYRIVELVFVLLYIQCRLWGSIEYIGTWCGDYYLIPQKLTSLIRWKILDSAVNEVSEALSMHVAPSAMWIVVVPAGVTVLLGLHNPPCSWTGMVGPSLPSFCNTLFIKKNSILQIYILK